jgi:lipoyl-dependent peroxiredoxin
MAGRGVARAHLGLTGADPTLTRMEIETEAEVPGLGERDFRALAEAADHARRTHQVTTETTS